MVPAATSRPFCVSHPDDEPNPDTPHQGESGMASRINALLAAQEALRKEEATLFATAEARGDGLNNDEAARADEITAELAMHDEELARWNRFRQRERAEIAELAEAKASDKPTGERRDPRQFSSFGEFLQAVAATDSRVASRVPHADTLLSKLNHYQAAASGMSVGAPSDGGFLVRKDWTSELLDRAREESQLLGLCRDVRLGADFDSLEYPYIDEASRATGSRWGGVQVYWKAEAATVTAKQPKIGKGELQLEEIMGLAYATNRLLRDSTALESILTSSFESEFAFKIDDSVVRGTGSGQMKGFFDTSSGAPFVSVAKETSQTAATVVAANITKMFARMPARLKTGAVWLIHPDVMTQLPLMTIGQMPVWLPPGQFTQAPNGLLLGKPVIELDQCEALGTQGDIFFVNLREYVVIRKAGEAGARYDTSMHVRFLYDEMAFRWVYAINGQPTWRTSLTPYKGSSSLSPYIGLDTRS